MSTCKILKTGLCTSGWGMCSNASNSLVKVLRIFGNMNQHVERLSHQGIRVVEGYQHLLGLLGTDEATQQRVQPPNSLSIWDSRVEKVIRVTNTVYQSYKEYYVARLFGKYQVVRVYKFSRVIMAITAITNHHGCY